ncbi:6699_t:CDS:2 [Funneliformis geosporum]|nr:6699_t:CDS:2 [Funneliformis geosporum]
MSSIYDLSLEKKEKEKIDFLRNSFLNSVRIKLEIERTFLRPFDEEINRDNIEQLFSPIYSSRLSSIVDVVMSRNFREDGNEGKTMGNIDCHINNLIELIQEYAKDSSNMSLDRNQAIQSSTTITENKKDRPNIAVLYNNVLVMMGEAKDINTKLGAKETQLDAYFD